MHELSAGDTFHTELKGHPEILYKYYFYCTDIISIEESFLVKLTKYQESETR